MKPFKTEEAASENSPHRKRPAGVFFEVINLMRQGIISSVGKTPCSWYHNKIVNHLRAFLLKFCSKTGTITTELRGKKKKKNRLFPYVETIKPSQHRLEEQPILYANSRSPSNLDDPKANRSYRCTLKFPQ